MVAFVLEHQVRDSDARTGANQAGVHDRAPLLWQRFNGTLAFVLVAVALGGAEGALEYFRHRITPRLLPREGRVQAHDPAAQIDPAESTLQVKSARLLLEDAGETVHVAGKHFSDLSRSRLAELRVTKAYIVRRCRAAIDRPFAASGGGALQETKLLHRYWHVHGSKRMVA